MDAGTRRLSEAATVVDGLAQNGKPCRVIDNTGCLSIESLRALLEDLIRERQFGLSGLSEAGETAIRIGAPKFTHIQLEDNLFSLTVYPYEAWLEKF